MAILARARRRLFALRRQTRGNVAIMSALFMPIAVGLAAIAVDAGSLYLERREAQSLVDLAAITAAANLDDAERAVKLTMSDNGVGSVLVKSVEPGDALDEIVEEAVSGGQNLVLVEKGHYRPDPALAPQDRFTPGGYPHNAVRVTMHIEGQLFFGAGLIDDPKIVASGIGHGEAKAAFSVGSRLARVDDGLLNALLNGLLGTNVSLSVMDYEALIDADVDLLSFIDGLASEIGITAGTYDDVLDSAVSIGDIAAVAADLTGSPGARSALVKLANDHGAAGVSVPLSHMFDLGALGQLALGEGPSALDAAVGVMQVLTAAAALGDGENQVALDLGLVVPGLAALTVDLAIGEPPQNIAWFAVGDGGETVRTAQTRLYIEARVGGTGLLSSTGVRLPLYLELAYAEARLKSVSCPSGRPESARVEVEARPGIADLWIAEVDRDSFRRFADTPDTGPARIVSAPLIRVKGQAHLEIGNQAYQDISFDHRDIEQQTIKQVATRDYVNSVVASLIGDLDLEVQVAILGLNLPGLVTRTVSGLITPLAAPLDQVVYGLLTVLGVRVGEADVRVHGVTCQRAVLVQ